LLPDLTAPMGIPSRADDGDSATVRERQTRISSRSLDGIRDAVAELMDLGLIKSGAVEVRVFATSPMFKLYVLNGEEAFFGFYPVTRHQVSIGGQQTAIFDAMGKNATLFQFTSDDTDAYADYV